MNGFDAVELADIHNHLVPGVDDGARTVDESLHHLVRLAAGGITRLAVSPHLDARLVHEPGAARERLERLAASFRELTRACEGRTDVPLLTFGQEVMAPDPDTARRICDVRGVGIAGTRYILVEFGFELGEDPLGVVRAMVAAGRRPIVAHPERYRRGDAPVALAEIRRWKAAGALLQVNGGSVQGSYTTDAEILAWRLLAEGLADLFSTDHHADARPVSPPEIGHLLARHGAGAQARRLLSENPQRILAGRETLPVAPHRPRRSR
ncbi:MAG TPA: CpsB/CapC family capsule biosynthesis tyrosine phosphatase [Longimicrobiales bacterium]